MHSGLIRGIISHFWEEGIVLQGDARLTAKFKGQFLNMLKNEFCCVDLWEQRDTVRLTWEEGITEVIVRCGCESLASMEIPHQIHPCYFKSICWGYSLISLNDYNKRINTEIATDSTSPLPNYNKEIRLLAHCF